MNEIGGFFAQFWLVLVIILFVGIVAWVFWPKNRQRLEQHGRIPLEDEEAPRSDDEGGERPDGRKDNGT